MHGIIPAEAQRSIFPVATVRSEISEPRKDCNILQWSFSKLATTLWPQKTASHLEFLTGDPERTCFDRLGKDRDPPAGVLVKLLRSPEGGRVIGHVMRGSKADWWQRHQLAEIHLSARAAYDAAFEQASRQLELGL
jgi:hypothetical protein